MVRAWSSDEYSHGYLIPIIALLMIWQNWQNISKTRSASGAWIGTGLVVVGLAMFLMGELGTLYVIVQYSFLITLAGVAITYFGSRSLRHLWVPLVYLMFMIPLPSFLYNGLSAKLQLISSELGVAFIKLVGISVLLEGNVIDLGVYKLQVAEACNGLRYLFPLLSFGFLMAYLYRGPTWHKAVLFLSALPITVFMNSLRIGIIGVLVEHYGLDMAEGFLHDFEGWVIFMACVFILFLETWLLLWVSGRKGPLVSYFNLSLPGRNDDATRPARAPGGGSRSAWGTGIALLLAAVVGTTFLSTRVEAEPSRDSFFSFPLQISDWRGAKSGLPADIVRTLKVDDYLMANYVRQGVQEPVNFYVAFYKSQRKGQSAHSPQSCIPGDGWEITDFTERHIEGVRSGKGTLAVNRAVIAKGGARHLVYYWFPQRGRQLTNEYMVKWYIFWDALTRNRTDGALVRLVTAVEGADISGADARLSGFLRSVYPELQPYLPG
jgi:exosortase D (VPLPA-CTERM-specific)